MVEDELFIEGDLLTEGVETIEGLWAYHMVLCAEVIGEDGNRYWLENKNRPRFNTVTRAEIAKVKASCVREPLWQDGEPEDWPDTRARLMQSLTWPMLLWCDGEDRMPRYPGEIDTRWYVLTPCKANAPWDERQNRKYENLVPLALMEPGYAHLSWREIRGQAGC